MLFLLVATVFSAGFGLIVRWAQMRRANLWAVGALNYVTASLFHLTRSFITRLGPPSPPTVTIGILGGIAYVSAYLMFFPFVARRGVSVATAVIRLGVVLPVLVSMLLWDERVGTIQGIGIVLALAALPLLTTKSSPEAPLHHPASRLRTGDIVTLGALAITNGLCMLSVRGYEESGVQGEASLFLGFLFGTAAIVGCIAWFAHRAPSSPRDLLPGILLGLCNALANLALVASLQELPGMLVFPFYSAVGVLFTALFARLAWQEHLQRLERIGMAITLMAVVLVNM